jgi:hypothetical protein
MGGFVSSLFGGVEPSAAAGDDPDSSLVVSIRKIASYNSHMAGLKETDQLVSHQPPLPCSSFLRSAPD